MNIFVFSMDPAECARWHCDAHVNSQIKEMCQMMGTAYRLHGITKGVQSGIELPKITHQNHPCAVWLRESDGNWHWAFALLCALFREKRRRFLNPHIYEQHLSDFMAPPVPRADAEERTPYALAMPECYKCEYAPRAYQAYFCGEKRHLAKWYGNQIPEWYS